MEVIQVLDRAFTILERFAESHNQPLTVRELAEHTHLKVPTVSRIVRSLMILGYLESLGRKSGYVLGRRFAELLRFYFDANPLRKAAQPHLVKYRELFGEYICISILLGYERHILSRLEPYREQHSHRHVIPDIEIPYSSVSGRLLLSSQPEVFQLKCFEWFGPPDSQWEGTGTRETFLKKLAEIRTMPYLLEEREPLIVLAYPIHAPDGSVAATFGTYMLREKFQQQGEAILHFLADTARRLEKSPIF